MLVLGCVLFVLFSFTIIGLLGEAMVVLAVLGLIVRSVAGAAHRVGGHH
jgi:hypothetical protein